MSDKKIPLTNLIKEIVFCYVKYYYDDYLKKHKLDKMSENDINEFINIYYNEKKNDLKKYIRNSLKKNQGDEYNSLLVENILLEMFNDPDEAIERIKVEILDYQNDL